jgi:hypothetical protein
MTIRPDHVLHEIPVSDWTEAEVFEHLRVTFDGACRDYPDVMESYVVAIVEMDDRAELKAFMRQALRETLTARVLPMMITTPTEDTAA